MNIQGIIDAAWDDRAAIDTGTQGEVRDAVEAVLLDLDCGRVRAAEPTADGWRVNEFVKKAILLAFRLLDNEMSEGPNGAKYYDKIASKFAPWSGPHDFAGAGFRIVPGAIVRRACHIGKGSVVMPSFINIGAWVDDGCMIDTWATVGSCAQIGKNVHLSGGVGIGGVLEPLQASPTIIEDDCFIGARSEVVEGVIVERGSVLSMGVFLSASTKIVDRETGEIFTGRVPAYSVVVPGTLPGKPLPDGSPGPSLSCAVIVKRVDAQTRVKTAINELLRH